MPESTWVTLLTLSSSTIIIGGFIGGTTAKYVLRLMSPRRFFQVTHACNNLAIAIIVFGVRLTGSYELFIVGRFFTGLPCGICYGILNVDKHLNSSLLCAKQTQYIREL